MRNVIVIFIFNVFTLTAYAQGEYNVWCFGDSVRLDFNAGLPPVVSTSSFTNGFPGATICDKSGNLLFYADRDSVWDSSHTRMLNGDSISNANPTQGLNILPFPCNDSLYYLFSYIIASNGSTTGGQWILYYSIINTNGNSGLGEIIVKNVLMDTNLTLGFGMTRHSNNRDYWITYQIADTNIFYSRLISTAGIGSPIVSQLGLNKAGPATGGPGSLEFSMNATTLVSCDGFGQTIQYYSLKFK